LGYALWMLLRPVLLRQPADAAQRQRAASVVQQHGRTSLARFTLFPDKAYWFSSGGSFMAYAVRRHMAVALGDPIGPAEDAEASITGFRDFCAHNDWASAFYQTQADTIDLYRKAGYDTLCIGHEGIIDLATFTLEGGSNKTLRSVTNRLRKNGCRAELYNPPLSPMLLSTLQEISDEWLTLMQGKEKRFSLGWFDDDYIRSSPVMAMYTPDGSISAFCNLVTEYTYNEITIDLMRHRRAIENGTMEFLFIELFQYAKSHGYATFNLGLSALAGVGENPNDPPVERSLHYVYEHVNQFYNFRGLHQFKEKYHPTWSPRYLVFPSYATLPAVGLTLESASSSRDFLLDYAANATRSVVRHLRSRD
jgi:phosphatidylglycerol lysyltransferase